MRVLGFTLDDYGYVIKDRAKVLRLQNKKKNTDIYVNAENPTSTGIVNQVALVQVKYLKPIVVMTLPTIQNLNLHHEWQS